MRFTHLLAASATLALLAAAPDRVAAAEPDLSNYGLSDPNGPPPTTVFWHCDTSGGSTPPLPANAGRWTLTDLDVDESQHPFVGTVHTGYKPYISAADGSRPHVTFNFSCELRAGEALPIFDAIYRVVDVKPGNYMRLKKVMEEKLAKDFTSNRSLIVVPVGSGVHFVFYKDGERSADTSIVRVLAVGPGGGTGAGRARIAYENEAGDHSLDWSHNAIHTENREGDTVPLVGSCQLTVEKIVPPDEKHRILGWVEFDPKPPAKGEK